MTGPEHFTGIETDGYEDSRSAWHQRQAQAHATLALAAADPYAKETSWAEVTRLCGPT